MKAEAEIIYEEEIGETNPDEWAEMFEKAVQLAMRGRYGYTGKLRVQVTFHD